MKFIPTILLASAFCWTAASAQETAFTVKLTTPLSTSSSHKGDAVSAEVISPDAFKGDPVQGHVTEVKSGNKIRGTSVLNFNFDTLQHAGTAVPISSSITSIANSKGQENVDEEGRVIRKTSNLGKAGAGTGLGAAIGGIAGGWRGAAIGAGVGAAASVVLIQVAAQGPREDFAAGAQFGLSVKSRGGPELASLKPNTSTAPPAAAAAPSTAVASSTAPAAAPTTAPAADTNGQPNFSTVKIDFLPGERTIFFDDFSDMASDEPPPHWKVRGGIVDLRTAGSLHELAIKNGVDLTSPSFVIPPNFTFQVVWTGGGQMQWHFMDKDGRTILSANIRSHNDTYGSVWLDGPDGHLGDVEMKNDPSKPVEFDLWAQQGRVRAYLGGKRLIDVNQVKFGQLASVEFSPGYEPVGLRSVRIAESAPDFSATISATGKYISHGINFDTDSDHLKPESGAVLKAVSGGLQKNPNLKLEIDGYTDSVGDANHNLDLSKRRAEAVRTVLVSQFGVDASRLTANGFGAAKPIGSNDTADGRAQNRRVEFLKQ